MTNIHEGSNDIVFHEKESLEKHILKNILKNKNRKIGNEWEVFLVDNNGHAITKEAGQKAIALLYGQLVAMGHHVGLMMERDEEDGETLSGLDIYNLGTITPEIGHQFEFSGSVSDTPIEAERKNKIFYMAIHSVAQRMNYTVLCNGFNRKYFMTSTGSFRSRSKCWYEYFKNRYNKAAPFFLQSLTGTSSSQVSIDSGSENFHEFFKTLLLIEPLLTLHFANSCRPNISVNCIAPAHTAPILSAWNAKSASEAVSLVVDRLMDVDVPFLPSDANPDAYQLVETKKGIPPTIRDLMLTGRLSEKTLNNAGGFLLSRPALRRFSQGIIELRGVDSVSSPQALLALTEIVYSLVYDDETRKQLLADYAHFSVDDIKQLHGAAASGDLHKEVRGLQVYRYIDDILNRVPFYNLTYTSSTKRKIVI